MQKPITVFNPYHKILAQVEKPSRYIGGEKFAVIKDLDTIQGSMALCFPDTYEIGMGHLGFKILYEQINKHPHLLAQRVFCPWVDMEDLMRANNLPLVSLEGFIPLNKFNVLGFSLQYELCYTNVLTMLDLANVPLLSKDRQDEHPIVMAGGPCATHSMPMDDFFDCVVIGDGEVLVVHLLETICALQKKKTPRNEILKLLSQITGVYVPSLYEVAIDERTQLEYVVTEKPIKRHFVESLKEFPFPVTPVVPHASVIFDQFSVELARGCTEGCRFCQAGMIYRPVREREPNEVIQTIMDGMEKGGHQKASLTCLSTADYSAATPLILNLLDKIKDKKAELGIASLRAYGLDPRVFDKMSQVSNASLTFAPEAGSQRMRDVINKNISVEDMHKTAHEVFSRGWNKMKLYFMIGLPTETMEDVVEIMEVANSTRNIGKSYQKYPPVVTVNVSTFVPKPHTPFQWACMDPLSMVEDKQQHLYLLSKKYKLNFRKHVSRSSIIEGILGRGDRRVSKVILEVWKNKGRFCGWHEHFSYDRWVAALEKFSIDPSLYLGTIPTDGLLPWSHIDVGITTKFLKNEWARAVKDRFSPPCGKPKGAIVHHSNIEALDRTHVEEKKKLICFNCGIACDLEGMVTERRDFLHSLNAYKEVPYQAPTKPTSILDFRDKRGQNVGYRYRINYTKIGPISFISHLDLQKVISRVLLRTKLPILYSEGHKLKPLIAFGPAITLGIQTLDEYFDLRMEKLHPENEIKKILQENCEDGLFIKDVVLITQSTPSIQSQMQAQDFFYPLEDDGKRAKLLHFLQEKKEFIQTKDKYVENRKTTSVDENIFDFIDSSWDEEMQADSLHWPYLSQMGLQPKTKGLKVRCKFIQGKTLRPLDLQNSFASLGLNTGTPVKTQVFLA